MFAVDRVYFIHARLDCALSKTSQQSVFDGERFIQYPNELQSQYDILERVLAPIRTILIIRFIIQWSFASLCKKYSPHK